MLDPSSSSIVPLVSCPLPFLLVNVNSLPNKISNIEETSADLNCLLIGVCETWLIPDILSTTVNIQNFNILRNDSPSGLRKHGVCLYYHKSLNVSLPKADHPNTCSIYLRSYKLHVLLVYRPPSNTLEMNQSLINFIIQFCSGREVCVMGDFNLPTANWSADPPFATSGNDKKFMECFSSLGLVQMVRAPTFVSSGRTLDLVFVTDPFVAALVETLPPLPSCGHCPVHFLGSFRIPPLFSHSAHPLPNLDWYNADYSSISCAINEIDWHFQFAYTSLNDSYLYFEQTLHSLIH